MILEKIKLPTLRDSRGNLAFCEAQNHIPFDVKRVYYLFDVPDGAERGAHAHKNLEQALICLNGSFVLTLDDGYETQNVRLSDPSSAVLIRSNVWRELTDFRDNAICLVLASQNYSEDDYIRNYTDFKRYVGAQ